MPLADADKFTNLYDSPDFEIFIDREWRRADSATPIGVPIPTGHVSYSLQDQYNITRCDIAQPGQWRLLPWNKLQPETQQWVRWVLSLRDRSPSLESCRSCLPSPS